MPSSTATSRSDRSSATVTAHGVRVDRSVTPARIEFPATFNICGPFVDRHLLEGRGAKTGRARADLDADVRATARRRVPHGECAALARRGAGRSRDAVREGRARLLFRLPGRGADRRGRDPDQHLPACRRLRVHAGGLQGQGRAGLRRHHRRGGAGARAAGRGRGAPYCHRQPRTTVGICSTICWRPRRRTVLSAATTPQSPCFWLYSSGSTGAPKASVHEHKDMIYTSEHYAVGTLGLTEDDVIFSAPKLFFAYGLGNSLSFPLWSGCTAILLEDRPTAENTLDMIRRFEPTLYFGVPTLYAAQVAAMEKAARSRWSACGFASAAASRCRPRCSNAGSGSPASTCSTASDRARRCTSMRRTCRGGPNSAPPARPCPATRCASSMPTAKTRRTSSRASWSCRARALPSSTGTSRSAPRAHGRRTAGSAPATPCTATPTAISSSAGAATTC